MANHSATPTELTAELVRRASVTPNAANVLDFMQGWLEELGFTCERLVFSDADTPDVDNLFARIGSVAPHFCFAGHVDVVPTGVVEDWSHPPFDAEIHDGMMYGRGTVDMKGGVACFMAAARDYLAAHGGRPAGSISLLITGDEEGPSVNGTAKVLEWMKANGHVPDHCLVGEPSNPGAMGDAIKIGRRGSLSASLVVHGTQGHAAYPHLADNPVHKLNAIIGRLLEKPLDGGSAHFEPSSLQVTSIDTGNRAVNVIPASSRAQFNIRFNDNHTADSLKSWLHGVCAAVTGETGGAYELTFLSTGDCFVTEPGPLVDLVGEAVQHITGRNDKPRLMTNGGTSDARFIKDYCPVLEFGLVGQTMHKIDECVAVKDLETLSQIYGEILDNYFKRFTG
jgi:succinyl-diaminopimelate desuccinylase